MLAVEKKETVEAPRIQEQDDFLKLFSHRYDCLWARHPQPDWRTESRYPRSDRLIDQGAHLFGVR